MSDISSQKSIPQLEALQAGAAASEATVQTLGQNQAFYIQNDQYLLSFFFGGRYSTTASPETYVGGMFIADVRMEIYSVSMFNNFAGLSGTTEFDIIRITPANVQTTIFTTRPAIPASSGNRARVSKVVTTNTVTVQSAGTTAPVMAQTILEVGDALVCSFITKQVNGRDAGISIKLRPTNPV
jgi:hypothetical protein